MFVDFWKEALGLSVASFSEVGWICRLVFPPLMILEKPRLTLLPKEGCSDEVKGDVMEVRGEVIGVMILVAFTIVGASEDWSVSNSLDVGDNAPRRERCV